jgi:outer membrane receptor protein involved in Fe transport
LGVDIRLLDLFHQWDNAWNTPVYEMNVGVDTSGNVIKKTYENHKTYAYSKPQEYAAYIQDKIEFASMGLIINVGLRWERWQIPHDYLQDPEIPMQTPLLKTPPKDRISPRLGISYPISDQAAFYCSYGHFYQFPAYKDLLSNINQKGPYPDRPNLQEVGIAIFNPNMKPELSVTYEVGVQVRLVEDVSMSTSVFYRELSDLIGVRWVKAAGYVMYDNVDFGNSKGVEISFVKQMSEGFSTRINYTISQTLVSSSSPITAAQAIGNPLPFRTYLANWDRTHDLSVQATLALPWRMRVSVTGQLRAGKPYTVMAEQPNTERMPWYRNVNLRISKSVELFGTHQSYYIQVSNLLDQRNIYSLYTDTGKWDDDGDPSTPYAHDANPKRISDGRRIMLGMSLDF